MYALIPQLNGDSGDKIHLQAGDLWEWESIYTINQTDADSYNPQNHTDYQQIKISLLAYRLYFMASAYHSQYRTGEVGERTTYTLYINPYFCEVFSEFCPNDNLQGKEYEKHIDDINKNINDRSVLTTEDVTFLRNYKNFFKNSLADQDGLGFLLKPH